MPKPATEQELLAVFQHDASFAAERDAHYEASWKARGGPGAFFTIVRPWDRFEAIAKRGIRPDAQAACLVDPGYTVLPNDILGIIQAEINAGKTERDDGTLQACIRDLRIYMALLAVEAGRMRTSYSENKNG